MIFFPFLLTENILNPTMILTYFVLSNKLLNYHDPKYICFLFSSSVQMLVGSKVGRPCELKCPLIRRQENIAIHQGKEALVEMDRPFLIIQEIIPN